jgi:predicted nuclease of predicted toxin-antitoxin system
MQRAILDGRIVVTKDDDFVQNYLLKGEPALLLIATGNIRNTELEQLLDNNLNKIIAAFANAHYVEMTKDDLIVHQ